MPKSKAVQNLTVRVKFKGPETLELVVVDHDREVVYCHLFNFLTGKDGCTILGQETLDDESELAEGGND